MKHGLRWAVFWGCVILVAGSAVGLWATQRQQSDDLRGWEDATQSLDVPYRLPLAGVNVDLAQLEPDALNAQLDQIAAAGFTWVRQPFLWQDIEPQQGSAHWGRYDALVAAVAAHPTLQLVAVIDGTPAWARNPLAPEHPFAPPASVNEYGRFAGDLAERYADTITWYQIWDEPNIKLHWGNLDPRPAQYVAMLRAAYEAVHAADGDARVIAAALAPTVETGPDNLNDLMYLQAIYDLGGGAYFDAAAGKPYGFDSTPYDRRISPDVLNFSHIILLREEMVRRGDGTKPLWGSNFGWNHLPDDWSGPPSVWGSVSAEQQQQYTRDAYARAAREWPWMGGLIVQHWQPAAPVDDPIQGFALAPVIDTWLADGGPLASSAMIPGLYPAQNPYTSYGGQWQFSDLGADAEVSADGSPADAENRITTQFEGTTFAVVTRRDDYLAYLYATVDGKPANALPRNRQGEAFIVLTAPNRTPSLDVIRVAGHLADGPHMALIVHRPTQGDDRWPIAGFAVAAPPDTGRFERARLVSGGIGLLALLGVVVTSLKLPWRRLNAPAPDMLRRVLEWVTGLLASLVVLLSLLMTWGETIPSLLRRDQPALALTIITAGIAALSPAFVLTLVALGVMFVLIYNRPLLGVMLVIFWSAFFLSTLDLLFDAFATVEVYLGLTVAAVIARAVVEWASAYRDQRRLQWDRTMWRMTSLDWVVVAFTVLAVVSLAWSDYRGVALRNLRVVVLEPVLFYGMLRVMPFDRRDVVWLVDTLLFTGAAIALVGIVLYVTGESVVEAENGTRRLISVYGSPNGVGLYLGRCLPFSLGYALLTPRGSWRWAYGLASGGVMLVAVLLSQSRGAILFGLPAAFIVALIVWRGRGALISVGLAIVAMIAIMIPLSLLLPRLGDLLGDTFVFRKHLWYSSVQLIREHPLTGVGLDQFLYWYRSRYLLPEAWQEPNLSIPHNVLLNFWVNLGVLGVVVAGTLQALYWRQVIWLRRKWESDPVALALVVGLAGSMADLLAHGLVDVGYFAVNLAFVFFIMVALAQRLRLEAESLDRKGNSVV